jgi:hypothetical protein
MARTMGAMHAKFTQRGTDLRRYLGRLKPYPDQLQVITIHCQESSISN